MLCFNWWWENNIYFWMFENRFSCETVNTLRCVVVTDQLRWDYFVHSVQAAFYRYSCSFRHVYTEKSFYSMNSHWFKGWRFKSGIALFVLRITWNYAYSPFKRVLRSMNSGSVQEDSKLTFCFLVSCDVSSSVWSLHHVTSGAGFPPRTSQRSFTVSPSLNRSIGHPCTIV